MEIYYPNNVPLFVCVGRNYVEHIMEMKGQRESSPMIFFKPSSALSYEDEVYIPENLGTLHYEVELTVLIEKSVKNVPEKTAGSAIWGYGIGIDLTLREMQSDFKTRGLSWGLSKGFDNSAPLGGFIKKDVFKSFDDINMVLKKNGKTVQSSSLDKMIFSPQQIVSYVSTYMTLKNGYVIMTGTPSGVGQVDSGDEFSASLGDYNTLFFKVRR